MLAFGHGYCPILSCSKHALPLGSSDRASPRSKPLELFFRGLAASVRDRNVSAVEAVQRDFAGSSDLRLLEVVTRAATTPANTLTTGWASELLNVTGAQWVSSLLPLGLS